MILFKSKHFDEIFIPSAVTVSLSTLPDSNPQPANLHTPLGHFLSKTVSKLLARQKYSVLLQGRKRILYSNWEYFTSNTAYRSAALQHPFTRKAEDIRRGKRTNRSESQSKEQYKLTLTMALDKRWQKTRFVTPFMTKCDTKSTYISDIR